MKVLLFIFFTLVLISTKAQEFDVPNNYNFKNDADLEKYQSAIIDCIKWLEKTPPQEAPNKRKLAEAFLVQYIEANPKINLSLDKYILDLCKKNDHLLSIFIGGWAKYCIENNYDTNDISSNYAGMNSLINYYRVHQLKKNKMLDELSQKSKQELNDWLKEEI